jgi:hypothetical protein
MKKLIDILGIVLPVIIIVLALIRRFKSDKSPGFNGLIIFSAVLLLLAGTVRLIFYSGGSGSSSNGPQPEPLNVSSHSSSFNQSLSAVMDNYFAMNEGFVNWDTVIVNKYANDLRSAIDSLELGELRKDSLIYLSALEPINNVKAEISSIIADPSFTEKRGSLNVLSDNLRNLLVIVKYNHAKVYWQECPMAFGDNSPGNWLSPSKAVRNPYLGIKDPKYGNSMLECGGPKDTINFMQQ